MRPIYGKLLICLGMMMAGVLVSCQTDEPSNNYMALGNVLSHFEASGIKIAQVQPLVSELVNATTGAAVMIGKDEIGIYKFDTVSPKSREILKRLRKDEYIYIMAMKYPVVVKGSFVFLGVNSHPKKHDIMNAIQTL